MNCFVTGTGTGVGKTYIVERLVRSLRQAGIDSVGFKPICCGDRGDATELHQASGNIVTLDEVNPIWLQTPVAPYAASKIEGRPIDLHFLHRAFNTLRQRHESIIVEGAGGWLVPITRHYSVADLAVELGFPVVIVAANVLGTLNHTLLTVQGVKAAGARFGGVVLNSPDSEEPGPATGSNREILEELLGHPLLAEVRHGQTSVSFQLS